MSKIAFCFLTYSDLNKSDLWNRFFSSICPSKYNIYIHNKTQITDKYFQNFGQYADNVRQLWRDAGRSEAPYITSCFWYATGKNGRAQLEEYVKSYMAVLGPQAVEYALAHQVVYDEASLIDALDTFEGQGCDELILVPSSAEVSELDRTIEALVKRGN